MIARRVRGPALAATLLVVALVLPFVVPAVGLGLWRTATRVRTGATGGAIGVDGETIAWASVGRGEPVLLVHGLRGEITVLLPLAAQLARHGRRVVLVDLPGHGRSAQPARPLTLERAAELVVAARERLGLPADTPLVGHSLGAWTVAWISLSRPEDCGDVVLVSPPGLPFDPPPYPLLLPRTARDAAAAMPLLFADPPPAFPPVLHVAVAREPRASYELLRSVLTGRYLLDGLVEGESRRGLVVVGREDRLVPPSVGRELAARSPRLEYAEIAHASHMVVWERPRELAAQVARFLDQPSSGASSGS
ncbi:MAG: hypothetical protein Kow0062_25550 [Acidobacteriota bacterium]